MRCRDVKQAMQACQAELHAKQRCLQNRDACDAEACDAETWSMLCEGACDAEKHAMQEHAMPTCMRNRDAGDAEKHALQRCAAGYAEKHAMKRSMRCQVAQKACIICIQMHMIHVRCT